MSKGRLARIEIKLIDPGERARKDYRNIPSLAEDIQTKGLIHPIAVKETDDGLYLLLAGGRRFAACKHLNRTEIDAKVFPSTLTNLEVKSIELAENLQRENLTFYEEANLEREILILQQTIQGTRTSGSTNDAGITKSGVADMIGVSREKLRQDIELAETMDKFPEIDWKNMKNRSEALKFKENIGKMIIRQEAVKRFDAEVGSNKQNKYLERIASSYVCGDFLEFVKQIPDNSVNLVEVDPPYAINLQGKKKVYGSSNFNFGESGYNEIDAADYPTFMMKVFHECYRVMAPDSFLICWFGPEPWFNYILEWLRNAKFIVRGIPCLWLKGETNEDGLVDKLGGQTLSPMRHLASAYEMFFYAKKGDPKIEKQGRTNVFSFRPVSPTLKIHPTERPIELMKEILTTFTCEGSKILVPFLGSGKTLLAAYESKMTAFGTDLGEEHRESFVSSLTTLMQ